jgi:rubrerythrin
MIFDFFKKKRKLHLRYVLQAAILIEREGEQFYGRLARRASDSKVKKICDQLALDEADHKKLFEDMLSRWVSLPADEGYLKSYIEKLKKAGLFYMPSSSAATKEDLLKHALEYENMTVHFYLSLEKEFPEWWKQAHIRRLVTEERRHADYVKSLIRMEPSGL